MTRVLLEGRPGAGKTTVARRLIVLLRERGVVVTGFTTEEIRDGPTRVGFRIESVTGERAVMAHVAVPGPPRVGRYGVDLHAFEEVALPALASAGDVLVIDELGKMELASGQFRRCVESAFRSKRDVLATVHAGRHPFTDRLKREGTVIRVTGQNRDRLPQELAALLAG